MVHRVIYKMTIRVTQITLKKCNRKYNTKHLMYITNYKNKKKQHYLNKKSTYVRGNAP